MRKEGGKLPREVAISALILPTIFKKTEIDNIVSMGCINALFAWVGRSIGIFGHIFDRKRQKQPLYRTPCDEMAYMTDL